MEKINFYTQSSLNDTPELRMVIDVSGNVGIGESNPTKTLEVVGDISFNGDLYQNGSLFQSGGGGLTDLSATSINDLSDVSLNGIQVDQSLKWDGEKLIPFTPGITASSITKQGQVLETLAGVCDGRTVVVESGSYTLANITQGTLISGSTSNFIDFPGSSISYKPPQGTKLVCYTFQFSTGRNDNDSSLGYKFLIDNTEITSFKRYDGMSGDYGQGFKTVHYVIEVGETDDIPNGKLSSWNNLKTIKLQVATEPNYNFWINKSYYDIQQGQTVPSPVISLPSAISLINHDGSAHSRDRGDLSKIIDSDDTTWSYMTTSSTQSTHGPFITKMDFPSSLIGSTLTQILFKHSSTESYTINAKFGILNGSTYTSLNVVSGINLGSGTTLNTGTVATWNNDTDWHIENYPYSHATEITVSNYVIQTNDKLVFRWTNNQTNKHWPLYYVKINTGSLYTNNPNNSSSTYVKKPILKITAIGESSGQAVTLTNNSVNDLSDISFNSTTTTNGQALVWNSTDAVWEAGAVASSGGGLTDLSATSISDLSDVSFNSTSTTQGNSLVWNNTDKIWEAGTPTTSIVNTTTSNASDWEELTTTGGPPAIRYDAAIVTYNNKLIVSGGADRSVTQNTWELNLDTNVWTEKTSITTTTPPYARHMLAIRYNNKMIVWGGYGSTATYDMWELNLDTYQWSNVTPSGMSHPNRHYTGDLWGSKLIYYGGYSDARGRDETTVTEVNLSTTPYTATTRISHGTSGSPVLGTSPNSVIYQDKMYVYGGSLGAQQLWELNLQNYTWSQKTYTGTAPSNNINNSMTVEDNGNMYIFGGWSGSHLDDFFKLDLSTLTWSIPTTTNKPSARYGNMGPTVKYNNKMYLFGGAVSGTRKNDTWAYTFPGNEVVTYNPVEINKLSTYYALSVGPNYDTSNMDNSGSLIVEGNVGIGLSDPSGYKLEVAGDISFNGSLYQNGALFTGGSTIDETTDVSMNNTTIHGILDVSTNFTAGGRTSTTITTSETIQWYTNQSNFTWNLTNDGTSTAPTARKNHSSVIDNSSNIVVFGGYDSTNSETNDVWKYNITNNAWSQLFTSTTPSFGTWSTTSIPNSSRVGSATSSNGIIYVTYTNSSSTLSFVKYNISSNTWSNLSTSNLQNVVGYSFIIAHNGYIYSVDGITGYRVVYRYDPNNDSNGWTQLSYDTKNTSANILDKRAFGLMAYNGSIYQMGGRDFDGNYYNDIWKFDLNTNTWSKITGTTTTSGSSSPPLFGYIAYTSNDDDFYYYGNYNSQSDSNIYKYNITNNTWTSYPFAISNGPRIEGSMTYYDNHLYIFSGATTSPTANVNEFVKYDLINESWTQITGSIPTGRRAVGGSFSIGNKYYIVGGYTSTWSDEVISYTLYSNTPNKMKHSSSILNGDEIVTVFGGSNSNTYYNSVYNFSLVDNNWTLITPTNDAIANSSEHGNSSGMPSPRHGHSSVKYNNKMYMFGGKDGSTTYYDTWEYDLTTTTWTKKALALSSHARYEHSSIIYNGDMYVFGGYDGTNYFNNILKYDITNNTWSEYNDGTASGTPTARYGHISVIMQNEMIIFGGTTQSGHVEDSYIFNFVDSSWNLLDNDDSNRPIDSYSTTAEIQYHNPSDNHYKLFVFGGETPLTNKLYVADISRNNVTNTTSTTIPNVLTFNSTNGRVGIGTNTPSKSLDVVGNGIFSGSVTANGSLLSSDDRIKHNEEPITNALSTISKLKPKHYFKTTSLYDESHHFRVNNNNEPINIFSKPLVINKDYTIETGIIAQELLDIPELKFAVQNTTPLGVDYNSIHCTHIAATNELHQLVKSQQTTIEEQQTEIEHLKLVNQDTNSQLNAALTELQTIKHYLGI